MTVARPTLRSASGRAVVGPAVVVAAGVGVLAVASWPAATLVVAAVLAIAVLSWKAPRYGFVAGLGAFAAEGTVKVLLTNGGSPFPFSPDAAGAALLDAALFVGVLRLAVTDRGRTPRAVWDQASRVERLLFAGLAVWLVLSVLELPFGGHLARSLAGLRL